MLKVKTPQDAWLIHCTYSHTVLIQIRWLQEVNSRNQAVTETKLNGFRIESPMDQGYEDLPCSKMNANHF